MSIHDPGAWSAHAQDYDGAFTGTILSSALPNHLFPHLDAALESASAGQRIGLLASACGPGTELHIILARYGKGGEKQHLGGRLKVLATDFAENMVKRVEGEVKNGGLAGTVEVECKVMDSMVS